MKALHVLVLSCVIASSSARADGDLEPEEGIFVNAPDPYAQAVRRLLVGTETYHLCLLVIMPSFTPESAVYIAPQPDPAKYGNVPLERGLVVSRTFSAMLWQAKSQPSVLEHTAELDAAAVKELDAACRAVLLRTRYSPSPLIVLDGTTYHAGHWMPGQFLAGKTHSPRAGTLAADFVTLELLLKGYAEAASDKRPALRDELVARARISD